MRQGVGEDQEGERERIFLLLLNSQNNHNEWSWAEFPIQVPNDKAVLEPLARFED